MAHFKQITVDPSLWLRYVADTFVILSDGIFSSDDLHVLLIFYDLPLVSLLWCLQAVLFRS